VFTGQENWLQIKIQKVFAVLVALNETSANNQGKRDSSYSTSGIIPSTNTQYQISVDPISNTTTVTLNGTPLAVPSGYQLSKIMPDKIVCVPLGYIHDPSKGYTASKPPVVVRLPCTMPPPIPAEWQQTATAANGSEYSTLRMITPLTPEQIAARNLDECSIRNFEFKVMNFTAVWNADTTTTSPSLEILKVL
jgi:hypothetical protein